MTVMSASEIDQLINEDVPYFDLTSTILGISDQEGKISYFSRDDAVVAGTQVVRQVFDRLGIETTMMRPSGQGLTAGGELMAGRGRARDLHMAWKVCQNILDSSCGIATKTRKMVDAVQAEDPKMALLTTRKAFPGTKKLAIAAILAGGAMPHRLGLSETIVIFKQHMNFIGGLEGLIAKLPSLKHQCCEKKIIVEAVTYDQAVALFKAGTDGVQFDKLSAEELTQAVVALREEFGSVIILGAGGINEKNISAYAKTGVNGIITTSPYNAKPIDVGVRMG